MTPVRADDEEAIFRASPNHGPRRDDACPTMVILHYTGMESGQAAEDWLCDPRSQVSSHYIVHEDGTLVQMVRECDRAWHAGRSIWNGIEDVNSHSIGIEIVNPGHFLGYPEFPDVQIEALIGLCSRIAGRHAIVPENFLAHSDVAPGRKIDPGEKFPWRRLFDAGIGHFVEPVLSRDGPVLRPGDEGGDVAALQDRFRTYGYGIESIGVFDDRTKAVVEAFQRHFRQFRVDGEADMSTVATLDALIAALP